MICHTHKCIFIHIPKVAGTSIIDAFGYSWSDKNSHFLGDGYLASPSHWKEYEECYKDYKIFTVIRNPYDRFVSGWKYCKSTQNLDINHLLKHLPRSGHDNIHITKRQSEFIFKDDKPIYNYLLYFENLQNNFDQLCDRIGKERVKLKKLNQTPRKNYKNYFTPFAKKMFDKIYEEDLRRFSVYKF
jgi:hypothetical protein